MTTSARSSVGVEEGSGVRLFPHPAVALEGVAPMDSGMTFTKRDVSHTDFWDELCAQGRIGDLPPPDFVHTNPLCRGVCPYRLAFQKKHRIYGVEKHPAMSRKCKVRSMLGAALCPNPKRTSMGEPFAVEDRGAYATG